MNSNRPIDVDALRDQTPGCHGTAFLNNAGAALPTQRTLDAMRSHLELESRVGGYRAADLVSEVLVNARAGLAQLVGGKGHEVALAVSDSAAWVKAIWGWMLGGNVAKGDVVAVDRLSYHSHYAALMQLSELFGFEVVTIGAHTDGTVDLDSLSKLVSDRRVVLACITAIGTHSGNVNPMKQIGSTLKARRIPMFVDGCQALAHLEVDVREWGASVFTGTGRKWLRAPRGTGMLWIAEEIVEGFRPPGIDGVSTVWDAASGLTTQPGMAKFEEFEAPIAAQVGLASAVQQTLALGMRNIESRVSGLAFMLRSALTSIDGVEVHDTAARRCGIVTFSVDGVAGDEVVAAASRRDASIGVSTANWAAIDMTAKGLREVVRVSPHIYNTDEEVSRVVEAVMSVAR